MYKFVLFFLLCFLWQKSNSQPGETPGSSEIFGHIKKLNVLGSVLYIAAHPDDENTRLLSYLANDKLYRTGYLSITRGDGGQNLIGDEQGVELGLIRTQELLAARRIDGAEQFFTRAYDFGYSKSPEETFKIWDKEKILSDVVWVIRKFQPDVIITRFPATGEGGHGHHTASAILAEEAFIAAADPNKFPEHLRWGVAPWQVKRLLWNTFNFGSTNTTSADQFHLDVGKYNSLLGKSYGEISSESRSQHKSQGFGVPSARGTQMEYFKTTKGEVPKYLLMDGLVTGWSRVDEPSIQSGIDEVIKNYNFQHPEHSVRGLLQLYQLIKKAKPGYWQEQKLKEIKNIIKDCAGLYIEAIVRDPFAVQGDSVEIEFLANNRTGITVSAKTFKFGNNSRVINEILGRNENLRRSFSIRLADTADISQPYWLQTPKEKGYYTVNQQTLIGQPWNAPISAELILDFDGEFIQYTLPVQYKSNDPVKGEQVQPMFIIPKIELQPRPKLALSINNQPENIVVIPTDNRKKKTTFKIETSYSDNVLVNKKDSANYYSLKHVNGNSEAIKWFVKEGGQQFDQYKNLITYDHIPPIIHFEKAQTNLIAINLKIAGKKVGYISGAGDRVPDALQKMGYTVIQLSQADITKNNLAELDAVVTGVRAYNIHSWLNDSYEVLMDYVKSGGVLLVQYNTNNRIGPVKAKIGPYTFTISRTRVTDENAAVQFSDPDNLLLNYPNKISPKDFNNWIQERSTYHAADYDENYKTLFSMHDEGEPAQHGSLIYTNFGKGRFVYTGLVFFRELPAGVRGAYRLFANLIAKPGNN